MGKELKTLLVVIFIFMMIAVMFQAVVFANKGNVVQQVMLEQFTSQPTRASDCRCLPGYVPSNTKTEGKTATFFCQSLSAPSNTKQCY
jgi:hypothetical protein